MKKWFLVLVLLQISCDEVEPEHKFMNSNTEVNEWSNITIQKIQEACNQEVIQNHGGYYTFSKDQELIVVGYVVSNDYGGNFYKKLVVQDHPNDPQFGLEILIDQSSLFEQFDFGRKVNINLSGLTVTLLDGEDNQPFDNHPDKYILGIQQGDEVVAIPNYLIDTHLKRTSEIVDIKPKVITFNEINSHVNTFVTLDNMQFDEEELGKTFSGEAYDRYDGLRKVNSCDSGLSLLMQTSVYADFKSSLLPQGNGKIQGVLTKDYYAEQLVLVLNEPSNIQFTSDSRCDKLKYNCPSFTHVDEVTLLEDFDDKSIDDLIAQGWVFKNSYGGEEVFELKKKSGNQYLEASAYGSYEVPMESWVVTPKFDLQVGSLFSFETVFGYYNGDVLEVFVSEDFQGEIETATWQQLDVDLPKGPASGYATQAKNSGWIDLSCLQENYVIGFRYLGYDPVMTTTVRLDNIQIGKRTGD